MKPACEWFKHFDLKSEIIICINYIKTFFKKIFSTDFTLTAHVLASIWWICPFLLLLWGGGTSIPTPVDDFASVEKF